MYLQLFYSKNAFQFKSKSARNGNLNITFFVNLQVLNLPNYV